MKRRPSRLLCAPRGPDAGAVLVGLSLEILGRHVGRTVEVVYRVHSRPVAIEPDAALVVSVDAVRVRATLGEASVDVLPMLSVAQVTALRERVMRHERERSPPLAGSGKIR